MTAALPPNSTIGIVGTGQLGRMLASAAAKLGFRVALYGPEAHPPAAQLANVYIQGEYDDAEKLAAFADAVDVATYEFENIPTSTVQLIEAAGAPVRPNARVLNVCQDRLSEKIFLREQGLKTADFAAIDRPEDIVSSMANDAKGYILKTRRFGYDGKGQFRLADPSQSDEAWQACGQQPSLLEAMVPFDFEVSQIAARSVDGDLAFFDLPENQHRDGILRESVVPSHLPEHAAAQAREDMQRVMAALDFVGVMTIEYFWSEAEGLIANEIAPRVHNSGHWTVEACATSQFEQHIRAIAGWPLGSSRRHSEARMTNLIGQDAAHWLDIAQRPGAQLTLYGKNEQRKGRKMGHVVSLAPSDG